jgi:hypothetical protein
MTHINRRTALAAVAAVPATAALGSVPALGLDKADPVFGAIAAHKAARKKDYRLYLELDAAEDIAEKEHGRRPWIQVAWRNYSSISGCEIDERRRWFLEGHLWQGEDPRKIELEYTAAKLRLRAAEAAADEWDKRTGVAPLREKLEQAQDALEDAAMRLAKTQPTTAAGASALLAYVSRDIGDEFPCDWHKVALKTVAKSLAEQVVS